MPRPPPASGRPSASRAKPEPAAREAREYFVACATGLEPVVADELRALGATDLEVHQRGIACRGPAELRVRANLWLRCATRVLEPVVRGTATTAEALYDLVRTVDWTALTTPDLTLAVDARVNDSPLGHAGHAALVVKDAVVDHLRDASGRRPSVNREQPDLPLVLHVFRERVTILRDTSGDSLHRRGYRDIMVRAPLNEALAAGILRLAGWDAASALADPMCGAGTLPIEAAMMAANVPPGLYRPRFAFEAWPDGDRTRLAELRTEAAAAIRRSLPFPIYAADHHPGALDLARQGARAAGVEGCITFEHRDIADFAPAVMPRTLVLNPPYGERLDADADLVALYRKIGQALRRFPGATAWVLSGNPALSRFLGLKASLKVPLKNGDLDCRLLRYEILPPRRREAATLEEPPAGG